MKTYRIAVIPGDGIGKEVVPAAIDVLNKVALLDGRFQFEWTSFPWGSDYYLETGNMMPENGIEILKQYDQIFLGAVGMPELVPDHISLWGLLIKIRREMQQSINVRPAKLLQGLPSPLRQPNKFDFIVVRENSEGSMRKVVGEYIVGKMKLQSKMPFLLERVQNVRCGMLLSLLKPVDNM